MEIVIIKIRAQGPLLCCLNPRVIVNVRRYIFLKHLE